MDTKTRIAIASDHGGFEFKTYLKDQRPDFEWIDLGTNSPDSVDYPDFADILADAIKAGQAETGVLVCGSGIGVSMAANRYKHIRAAVCANTTMARLTRIDNNANVLCLGARTTGPLVALDIFDTFMNTKFEGGGRHERRVNKLSEKGT